MSYNKNYANLITYFQALQPYTILVALLSLNDYENVYKILENSVTNFFEFIRDDIQK